MTDVQDVKAAIGQHDPLSSILVFGELEGQGLEGQNFISSVHFNAPDSPCLGDRRYRSPARRSSRRHRIESRSQVLHV